MLFAVPVVAVLLALGAPFLHVKWGGIDARMKPTSAESHQVSDTLLRDFPDNGSTAIQAAVSLNVAVATPAG